MKAILILCAIGLVCFNGIEAQDDRKTCEGCEKIVNLLSNITHNEQYKPALVKLCDDYSFLPGKQTIAWCTKAVDRFYEVVNKNLNTQTVCYDIHACKQASSFIRDLHRVILSSMREKELDDKNTCDFCVFVSNKIKDIIVGGPTELEIKTHIEDACHVLSSIEQECVQIVNEYFDTLFTYLNQTFQPLNLCESMKMCPKGVKVPGYSQSLQRWNTLEEPTFNPAVQSLIPEQSNNPINCVICKKLVKIIQHQLKDNATDQQIINVLTEACELCPKSDRDNCRTVVKDYTIQLIQTLTQDMDPSVACALAGLCVPTRFTNYLNGYYLKRKPTQGKLNNVACEECELIGHFIQNEMYNFKNEEQVETIIKNVMCKQLSYFIKEKDCDTFVNDYTPLVMQLIAQEIFDPTTLCFKEIKVCKSNTKSKMETNCEKCKKVVDKLSKVPTTGVVSIEEMTETVCKFMPRPAKVECALMMKAFGSYFAESLDRYESAHEICRSIDLCLVPGRVHLLGGHKCTFGPSYWCHSEAHANACSASSYCKDKVWNPSRDLTTKIE